MRVTPLSKRSTTFVDKPTDKSSSHKASRLTSAWSQRRVSIVDCSILCIHDWFGECAGDSKDKSNDTINGWSVWSGTSLLNSAMGAQSFTDPRRKDMSRHFASDWQNNCDSRVFCPSLYRLWILKNGRLRQSSVMTNEWPLLFDKKC